MKKLWPFILILLALLPAARFLFGPGYFVMHDDLQVMRVLEMDKCFNDGQIPCRWSPDMVWGYGQAMFNFYSAFPYYLGALIRMVTPLSILGTVKILFLISFIGSAFGMYLLVKEFWGKWPGILAAILYAYAPYHSVDIYVRGALAESFALAIVPFLWLCLYRVIKKPNFGNVALGALSLAALFTTHNISTLILAPATLFWAAFWLLKVKNLKSLLWLGIAGILGVGLSSFFLVPAIFEQSLIQTNYLISDYSDFHAHFVTLYQLFISRHWGYGPSIFGPNDDLSFQIGWPHWWLGIIVFVIALFGLKKKQTRLNSFLIFSLLGAAGVSAFLIHPRSLFIWERIPLMAFIQFPWRFLGPTIFFLSFAAASVVANTKIKKPLALGISLLVIALNIGFFVPKAFSSKIRDVDKLTGVAWDLQRKAAILDYLPKTVETAPPGPVFPEPKIIEGDGAIDGYEGHSNRFSFEAHLAKNSTIELPSIYYPGWIVISDSQVIPSQVHGVHGVIEINLPAGNHIIRGRFVNTPLRTLANSLTGVSAIIIFLGYLFWENRKPKE